MILKSHFDEVERHLLAISKIPANSGHTLHKGTPREAFIKEFLSEHLSERVAIGTGEIVDAQSMANEHRNQIDIVIYKRDYPKISFGGGVYGFLAESVVAKLEVKSVLTQPELKKAIKTANTIKNTQKNLFFVAPFIGYHPPNILSYVIAYDGPAKINTVHSWITPLHNELGISYPVMGNTAMERTLVASPSIDGVFILGKGSIHFDNSSLGFLKEEVRMANPDGKWVIARMTEGNLLYLFMLLTFAISNFSVSWLNPLPYLSSFGISDDSISLGK